MSEQTTSTREQLEVKRLGFLMKLYLVGYALGIVFLLLCAFLGNNMVMFAIGVFFLAQAIGLDIYVRIKRTQLNAKLKADAAAAGADIDKLQKELKEKRKRK